MPDIYVVDQQLLGKALFEVAQREGISFFFNDEVQSISRLEKTFRVSTQSGVHDFECVINAAGLYADRISAMAGYDHYTIYPYRGEYYEVTTEKKYLIESTLVYPALPPGHPVKGIHFTKTCDGRLLIGPNVTRWNRREDDFSIQSPKKEFIKAVGKFLPGLEAKDLQWAYSGIRPKLGPGSEELDFVLKKESTRPTFINLLGIESPGLSASFAIAEYAVDLLTFPYHLKR